MATRNLPAGLQDRLSQMGLSEQYKNAGTIEQIRLGKIAEEAYGDLPSGVTNLTSAEALERYDVTLPTDQWQLRVDPTAADPFSYVSPDQLVYGDVVRDEDGLITDYTTTFPTGETFSLAELMEQQANFDEQTAVSDLYREAFGIPYEDIFGEGTAYGDKYSVIQSGVPEGQMFNVMYERAQTDPDGLITDVISHTTMADGRRILSQFFEFEEEDLVEMYAGHAKTEEAIGIYRSAFPETFHSDEYIKHYITGVFEGDKAKGFVDNLRTAGWNDNTVDLLTLMFGELTPADLAGIFGEDESLKRTAFLEYERDLLIEQMGPSAFGAHVGVFYDPELNGLHALDLPNLYMIGKAVQGLTGQFPFKTKRSDVSSTDLVVTPFGMMPKGNLYVIDRGAYTAQEFYDLSMQVLDRYEVLKTETGYKFGRNLLSGVGSLVNNIGGVFRMMGAEGIGNRISEESVSLTRLALASDLGAFQWNHLLNPEFWATSVASSLPTTLALMIPSMGAFSLAAGGAAALGLGTIGQTIVGAVGGALISRPLESALEAAQTYDTARANGANHAEARAAAGKTFKGNMKLVLSDAPQLALAFIKVPARILAIKNVINRGLAKVAWTGGKFFIEGLTEGGEEVYQSIIQNMALGDKRAWTQMLNDPEMREVFAIGAVMGVGFGLAGEVMQRNGMGTVTTTMKRLEMGVLARLSPEQQTQFKTRKRVLMGQNINEGAAILQALEEMSKEDASIVGRVEGIVKASMALDLAQQIITDDKATVEAVKHELAKTFNEYDINPEEIGVTQKDLDVIGERVIEEKIPVTEPERFTFNLNEYGKMTQEERIADIGKPLEEMTFEEYAAAVDPSYQMSDAYNTVPDLRERWEAQRTQTVDLDNMTAPIPEGVDVALDEVNAKIDGLEAELAYDSLGQIRFQVPVKKRTVMVDGVQTEKGKGYKEVDITYFISIREQTFPEYFTVKQARLLFPGHNFDQYTQKDSKLYNHVPKDEALYDLTERLDMTPDEIAEQAMHIRDVRNQIKLLQTEVTTIQPKQAKDLTPAQKRKIIQLFAQYLISPEAVNAWDLVKALRTDIRAKRAENYHVRLEELVLEKRQRGQIPDYYALSRQARKETASGAFPTLTEEYVQDVTDRMRKVLMEHIHMTLTDAYEIWNTETALDNALMGKPIPRDPGSTGRSAFTRLYKVFGSDPEVIKAIEQMSSEGRSLADAAGALIEDWVNQGKPPSMLDAETGEYVKTIPDNPDESLPATVQADMNMLKLELALSPPRRRGGPAPTTPDPHRIVNWLKKIGMFAMDIGNMVRAIRTSIDLSAGRQLAPLIVSHPVKFTQALRKAWSAMWSPTSADAAWNRITSSNLYNHIYKKGLKDYGDKGDPLRPHIINPDAPTVSNVEEYGLMKGQERLIPKLIEGEFTEGWQHLAQKLFAGVRMSERAFITMTNDMVWSLYEERFNQLSRERDEIIAGKRKPPKTEWGEYIVKEMHDWATYLAEMTGRASLGKTLSGGARFLNAFFFAPRLMVSRLVAPRHLFSGNRYIRKQAWKDMTTFIGMFTGMLLLGKHLDLWEVEFDPRSADFLTARVGNTRIDPWGGFKQYAVLYARLTSIIIKQFDPTVETMKSSTTGATSDANLASMLFDFMRSKAAPMTGEMLNFYEGKNYVGEEIDVTNPQQWLEATLPFSVLDITEAIMEHEFWGLGVAPFAFLGMGAQTYSGDWREDWANLGLSKYEDNTFYGDTEPLYDVKDFWADNAASFSGTQPGFADEDRGFEPYMVKFVEAVILKNENLKHVPSQAVIELNADPAEGSTFEDYYALWQERQRLVAAGDQAALEAFDKGETDHGDVTTKAYMGNMTQSQYSLLKQYYLLDERDQVDFLEVHPELTTNRQQEYLTDRPEENALLAIWGQAPVYSKAALNRAESLVKELGIPEVAVMDYMPNPTIADSYFDRIDIVNDFGRGSWEDKLFLAENPDLAEFLNLQISDTPIEALQLQVDHHELFKTLKAYSDEGSEEYIADDQQRAEAVADLRQTVVEPGEKFPDLASDTEFRDIERMIDVIKLGFNADDEAVASYIGYMRLKDEGDTIGANLYRADNPEFDDFLTSELIWGDNKNEPLDESRIPIWRITDAYKDQDAAYQAILDEHVDDVPMRNQKIAEFLGKPENMEYAQKRLERAAYEIGYTDPQLYVDYMNLPDTGHWRERFRAENPEFDAVLTEAHGLTAVDPSTIPNVEYDQLYQQYQPLFEEFADRTGDALNLNALKWSDSMVEIGQWDAQTALTFKLAYYRRQAWGDFMPEEYVDNYVEYYLLPDTGWAQERYLAENLEFYYVIKEKREWIDTIEFDMVPSEKVEDLYNIYLDDPEVSATANTRLNFRYENPELDDWMMQTGKVSVPAWQRVELTQADRNALKLMALQEEFDNLNLDELLEELRR